MQDTITAVAALEAVALGETYDTERAAAAHACEALRAAHHAKVFPQLKPADSEVLLAYADARDRVSTQRLPGELLRLHAAAFASWPELAAHVRGFFGRRDVEEAALGDPSHSAGPDSEAHAVDVLRRFEMGIASQLVDDPDLGDSAGVVSEILPALEQRIETAVDRQIAHAAAAAAVRVSEAAAAAAAVAAAARSRKKAVADYFGAFASQPFLFRNRTVTGQALANTMRGNLALDMLGQPVLDITVDELERLRAQTEAAATATA